MGSSDIQSRDDSIPQCFQQLPESFRSSQRKHAENQKVLQAPDPERCTPSWLRREMERKDKQVAGDSGIQEWTSSAWCSSCGYELCICNNLERNPSPLLPIHPYREWLPGPEVPIRSDSGSSSRGTDPDPRQVSLGLLLESESTDRRSNGKNDSHLGASLGGVGGVPQSQQTVLTLDSMAMAREEATTKAQIMTHPLFAEMLENHVRCLRALVPIDQHHRIDEQLSSSHLVMKKYAGFISRDGEGVDDKELSHVMRDYTLQLSNLHDQLQHHVKVHAADAMKKCKDIEDKFFSLTGMTAGEGKGATMSDNEEEPTTEEISTMDSRVDLSMLPEDVALAYGPAAPTETERSILERLRQELKLALGEKGYRNKLTELRDEILRKRQAGKLPEGTASLLKSWWDAHSKWPYPTEEEKEVLIQETKLELKQINNWFINQRKRKWKNPQELPEKLESKKKTG